MRNLLLSTFVLLAVVVFETRAASDIDLLELLFKHYDEKKKPDDLVVAMGIILRSCPRLDSEGNLKNSIYKKLTWEDDRLTWKPFEHQQTDQIRVRKNKVWFPEVKLTNGVSSGTPGDADNDARVTLTSKGVIIWSDPREYTTRCEKYTNRNNLWKCQLFFELKTLNAKLEKSPEAIYGVDDCSDVIERASAIVERVGLSSASFYVFAVTLDVKGSEY